MYDDIYRDLEDEEPKLRKDKKNNKNNKRRKRVFLSLFILLIIGSALYLTKDYILDFLVTEEKEEGVLYEGEIALDENYVEGLRRAAIEKHDNATLYFDDAPFHKLEKDDQYIILNTYLLADQAQKSLDLDSQFDKYIIDFYAEHNELERLKELKTNSKLIEFEIAVLENDYEKIIETQDVERLVKDERRARHIANAYYKTGDAEQAVKFANQMLYDSVNVFDLKTALNTVSVSDETSTSADKGNNGLLLVMLVFFIIVSSVSITLLIQKIKEGKQQIEHEKNKEDEKKLVVVSSDELDEDLKEALTDKVVEEQRDKPNMLKRLKGFFRKGEA